MAIGRRLAAAVGELDERRLAKPYLPYLSEVEQRLFLLAVAGMETYDYVCTRGIQGEAIISVGPETIGGIDHPFEFDQAVAALKRYCTLGWAVRAGDRYRLTPRGVSIAECLATDGPPRIRRPTL